MVKKGQNKIISVNKANCSQLQTYKSIKYIYYLFSLLLPISKKLMNSKEAINYIYDFILNISQVNMSVCLSIQLSWLLQSEHAHTCII